MSDYNPKKDRGPHYKKSSFTYDFLDVENPAMLQVKDPEKVKKLLGKYNFVHYAGDENYTYHSLLHYLNSAKDISQTQGACHNAIKTFAFDKMDMRRAIDPVFDFGEDIEPLEVAEKKLYSEFIKERITIDFHECIDSGFDDIKSNGNYFLELVLTEVAGKRFAAIHFHPINRLFYWATKKGEPRAVAVSPVWTEEYVRKNGVETIPIFPNFSEEDGVRRTMLHTKLGNYNWYGRPDWIGGWMNTFRQHQDLTHKLKRARRQWMAELFIEMESGDEEYDDPFDDGEAREAGYKNSTERAIDNFTSESNHPSPIWQSTRPYGSRPAFVHEFKPTYNENHYKIENEIQRQAIIESNSWSERLLGNAVGEGLGSEAALNDLKIKDVTVLSKWRNHLNNPINTLLQYAVEWIGFNEFLGLEVYNKSVYSRLAKNTADHSELKTLLDGLGVAARAGVFTPTQADEELIRSLYKMPSDENVTAAWDEDGGFRKPITLKGDEDSVADLAKAEKGNDE